MGTAMNKSIKDIITRSYAMRGYYTPYIPGWDNHGMPIESAIIKQNKLNHKAMSIPDFRSACHEFADHYVGVQRDGFKRMGVVGDWDHPYSDHGPRLRGAGGVVCSARCIKKGYIYKDLKPVYWCPHDETALARRRSSIRTTPCTTVYVKFPMYDDLRKALLGYDKLYFVIWTTTIWTLPGNLAIALHPDEPTPWSVPPTARAYIMAGAWWRRSCRSAASNTARWRRPTPAPSSRICWPTTPSCPRPPSAAGGLRHHGLRHRLRPHRPRLRCR